jgi:hypothetical protein
MAGVSAYAALGHKLLAPAPGGSTRRLQGFDILRTDGKLDIYVYIYDSVVPNSNHKVFLCAVKIQILTY